jgi:hypothetical protein
MNLGDVKRGLRTIDLLFPNDFENGGLSPVEMQTCLRLKRVTPRWCKEDDHKAICRMSLGAYKMLVTAMH